MGDRANRNFLWFFQFQAAFVVFFSLPFALVAQDEGSISRLVWVGVVVWAVGNAGAIVADRQLAAWRANPANRGQTARYGLWSWSRHPNYFFEWLTWIGNALVATTAPWGWLAWFVPAVLAVPAVSSHGHPRDGGTGSPRAAQTTRSTGARRASSCRCRLGVSGSRGGSFATSPR